MSKLNKLITAVSVALLTSGAAIADMSGFGIGVTGSSATFDTKGYELESGELERTSISKDVEYPAIWAEYSSPSYGPGLAVTLGVEFIPGEAELGAKSRTDTTADANEDDQDDSTYTAKAEVSDYMSIYLEPTLRLQDNFGIYIRGAVSEVTVNSLESIASGTDSSTYGNETILGGTVGVGITGQTEGGLYWKLSHETTKYETVELTSTTGNKNTVKAKPEQEATRLAIGIRF